MVKFKDVKCGVEFDPVTMKRNFPLATDFNESFESFNNSSCLAIYGPSNSGKSTKLIQMFKPTAKKSKKRSSFYGLFDNIVLCSPSLHTIGGKDNIFQQLPPENIFTEFGEDLLTFYYNMLNEQKVEYDELHNVNINAAIKR